MKLLKKEELEHGKYYSWENIYNNEVSVFKFDKLNSNLNIEYSELLYRGKFCSNSSITNINWINFRKISRGELLYYLYAFESRTMVPRKYDKTQFKKAYINFTYKKEDILDVSKFRLREYLTWDSGSGDEIKLNNNKDIFFNGKQVYCYDNDVWAGIIKNEDLEKEIMNVKDTIIPPILMRDGYAAMTKNQQELFSGNVNPFTGETTKQFIIDYYKNECCGQWKKVMEKEFPFLLDELIDFSKIDSGELARVTNHMLRVKTHLHYGGKSFLLNGKYNWEIKKDALNNLVLIPTIK